MGFWDIFTCSVDKNTELTDAQKLTYLRGQLEGEAKQLLAGFKLESINYAPALKLLIDHYGQIDRIKLAIVTNLCQLNTPSNNIEDLKHFYADFESLYKSVEAQDNYVQE